MLLPTECNAFALHLHNNIFVSGRDRKKRRLDLLKSRILFNIKIDKSSFKDSKRKPLSDAE
jgi:hypothetical protein